jgi:uncharacterized protein (DUF1697 family)
MRYAALLRAVNLVRVSRIAMSDLRRILTELGCADVTTHLQSGNAAFLSELPPAALERDIANALAAQAGLSCAVMVRTGAAPTPRCTGATAWSRSGAAWRRGAARPSPWSAGLAAAAWAAEPSPRSATR